VRSKWRWLYAKLPANLRARLEGHVAEASDNAIRGDQEYRVAQDWAERFRTTIAAAEQAPRPAGVTARRYTATIDALREQLQIVERELRAYEGQRNS
jgi:hypothetical protein